MDLLKNIFLHFQNKVSKNVTIGSLEISVNKTEKPVDESQNDTTPLEIIDITDFMKNDVTECTGVKTINEPTKIELNIVQSAIEGNDLKIIDSKEDCHTDKPTKYQSASTQNVNETPDLQITDQNEVSHIAEPTKLHCTTIQKVDEVNYLKVGNKSDSIEVFVAKPTEFYSATMQNINETPDLQIADLIEDKCIAKPMKFYSATMQYLNETDDLTDFHQVGDAIIPTKFHSATMQDVTETPAFPMTDPIEDINVTKPTKFHSASMQNINETLNIQIADLNDESHVADLTKLESATIQNVNRTPDFPIADSNKVSNVSKPKKFNSATLQHSIETPDLQITVLNKESHAAGLTKLESAKIRKVNVAPNLQKSSSTKDSKNSEVEKFAATTTNAPTEIYDLSEELELIVIPQTNLNGKNKQSGSENEKTLICLKEFEEILNNIKNDFDVTKDKVHQNYSTIDSVNEIQDIENLIPGYLIKNPIVDLDTDTIPETNDDNSSEYYKNDRNEVYVDANIRNSTRIDPVHMVNADRNAVLQPPFQSSKIDANLDNTAPFVPVPADELDNINEHAILEANNEHSILVEVKTKISDTVFESTDINACSREDNLVPTKIDFEDVNHLSLAVDVINTVRVTINDQKCVLNISKDDVNTVKEEIDIISISSEKNNLETITLSSTQETNDTESIESDTGYQSSDFEFITEEEAKMDGLIINFRPENTKATKNNDSSHQTKTIAINEVPNISINDQNLAQNAYTLNQNQPGPSNLSKYYSGYYQKPKKSFQFNSDYRINHVIPQGEEYNTLFSGIYDPMFRQMEHKTVRPVKRMRIEYDGIGFDGRLVGKRRDTTSDDEFADETKETRKQILLMYPEENRKRRRKF